MIAHGLVSKDHVILAHVIPTRRCNLACTYCNEFDDFSKPVEIEVMYQRLDQLARLGTAIITISGGEPLLHPDLDLIIAHIRKRGMIAGMITNGYLLTAERIQRLNRAGLDHLQISIDNAMPDEVSKKSLKVLDKKLQLLSEHADFHVNINSVVGGGSAKSTPPCAPWKRAATRASTISRTTSRTAKRIPGDAGQARAICTCVRTGWCITARSSAGIPQRRWRNTRWPTSAANIVPRKAAHHGVRWPAYTRSLTSISGAASRT
jgi:hypothetical protein